jgi:phosphoglycolate phosphatase
VGDVLLLWDIDGTLLRSGPIAAESFNLAIERVVGRRPDGHGVSMGGKTDPQIAAEILATMAADPAHAPEVLAVMEEEMHRGAAGLLDGGLVLPGVAALLAYLHGRPGVTQTVLTGNTRANALLKLQTFELGEWFDLDIGAYGSDHADRRELVAIARERARVERSLEPDETWIIGDTPNDLAAAEAGGARCLLVATGRIPVADLEGLGADAVLDDLSDLPHVCSLLLGSTYRSSRG